MSEKELSNHTSPAARFSDAEHSQMPGFPPRQHSEAALTCALAASRNFVRPSKDDRNALSMLVQYRRVMWEPLDCFCTGKNLLSRHVESNGTIFHPPADEALSAIDYREMMLNLAKAGPPHFQVLNDLRCNWYCGQEVGCDFPEAMRDRLAISMHFVPDESLTTEEAMREIEEARRILALHANITAVEGGHFVVDLSEGPHVEYLPVSGLSAAQQKRYAEERIRAGLVARLTPEDVEPYRTKGQIPRFWR